MRVFPAMYDSRRTHLFCLLFTALIALTLSGCSFSSVRHLQRQAWVSSESQVLNMDYWTFAYVVERANGKILVTGEARPNTDATPEWAAWIDQLWLAVYVSDSRGEVLGDEFTILPSQPLSEETVIPFAFEVEPDRFGSEGDLYITFGYRMVLARSGNEPSTPDRKVFFASEGAVTRY